MAIISICSRRGARLDVLSLTESHWILDREYPFVTVEFLLHPESNLEDVALVLHGQLLEENEYKTLRTRPFYQRLLRYVETGHHHRGDPRVYDFSSSFLNPHLPSNEAYEPPFTSVEPIEGADNYRVYGIEAHHKRCNFGAGNVAGRELAFVNIRPADGRFGGKLTYGSG